ncbi:MFS transporter [Streptomyces kurssanovii]|nr:MFS transporter [Streptomyces kurssanovii]
MSVPSPSGSREEALPEAVAAVSLKGHRSFNAYLTGEAASLLGTSVHAVALPALAVLELGAGPDQVALLALLGHLPSFVLALPAGVIVDRHGKKRLLVVTDLVAAAAVALIPVSAAAGVLSIAVLYAVALTVGAATVLHNAAAISVVPQLVPAGLRHVANSRVGVAFSSADIAGTYAGTAVVAVVGASRAFALDAVSYLLSAWCASRIRLERPAAVPVRRRMMRQIVEGMGYVARDPLARPLVASLALTGLGTGMVNTYWGFHLLTALQAGPVGLGVVMGVCGAGGLVGAFLAPRLVRRFGPGRVLVTSFTLCAAMGVPLLLARPGPLWLAVLAVAGMVQMAGAACAGTTQRSVRQQICPPELQGRAQQTSTWLVTGSRFLATAAAGVLAATTSVPTALVVGTVLLFAPVVLLCLSPVRGLARMPVAPADVSLPSRRPPGV